MLRTLALALSAVALAVASLAVLFAGPLMANPAVSIVPSFALRLPAYLLSLAG